MKSLTLHLLLPTLAFLSLLLIGIIAPWGNSQSSDGAAPAVIAFEHQKPLTALLRISRHGNIRLMDIGNEAQETVYLSVPYDWHRTEVRGAALKNVTMEPPALGFIRWRLPPRAAISFRTEGRWTSVQLRHPTRVPLTLKLTSVDLDHDRATHDVILVQEEIILPL